MTHEEAKKMGATHYDDFDGYYKITFFIYKWSGDYECDWHIMKHEPYFEIKPL